MVTTREGTTTSQQDGSEKPVREQLRNASISKASTDSTMAASEDTSVPEVEAITNGHDGDTDELRGRLPKKRSFDEVESIQQQDTARQHTRKRSRDSTAEEAELNNGQRKSGERSREDTDAEGESSNGHPKPPAADRSRTPENTGEKRNEAAVEAMGSPRTKKSRLHSSTDVNGTNDTILAAASTAATETSSSKVPPTSGFANTSAQSPFASLSGSKSPSAEPQTSSSAFASSGFSALTGTSSGFGTIGKSTGGFGAGGGFATGSKSPSFASQASIPEKDDENATPASGSTFGGTLGQQSAFSSATGASSASAFGSSTLGFGKTGTIIGFGGGFGSSSGFGGLSGSSGLTSFASGKPSNTLAGSSKPAKAFGAPVEEGEDAAEADEAGDDAGFKSPLSQESDKQDERFYEQELETGEEDEITEFSGRAKLYHFVTSAEGKKEWKERGLGVVRLNVRKAAPGEDDTKPQARLLMRADGSHRVILNTAVRKEITFGAPGGGAPQSGLVAFMAAVDGKSRLELLQLKARQQVALELHEKIVELQEAM